MIDGFLISDSGIVYNPSINVITGYTLPKDYQTSDNPNVPLKTIYAQIPTLRFNPTPNVKLQSYFYNGFFYILTGDAKYGILEFDGTSLRQIEPYRPTSTELSSQGFNNLFPYDANKTPLYKLSGYIQENLSFNFDPNNTKAPGTNSNFLVHNVLADPITPILGEASNATENVTYKVSDLGIINLNRPANQLINGGVIDSNKLPGINFGRTSKNYGLYGFGLFINSNEFYFLNDKPGNDVNAYIPARDGGLPDDRCPGTNIYTPGNIPGFGNTIYYFSSDATQVGDTLPFQQTKASLVQYVTAYVNSGSFGGSNWDDTLTVYVDDADTGKNVIRQRGENNDPGNIHNDFGWPTSGDKLLDSTFIEDIQQAISYYKTTKERPNIWTVYCVGYAISSGNVTVCALSSVDYIRQTGLEDLVITLANAEIESGASTDFSQLKTLTVEANWYSDFSGGPSSSSGNSRYLSPSNINNIHLDNNNLDNTIDYTVKYTLNGNFLLIYLKSLLFTDPSPLGDHTLQKLEEYKFYNEADNTLSDTSTYMKWLYQPLIVGQNPLFPGSDNLSDWIPEVVGGTSFDKSRLVPNWTLLDVSTNMDPKEVTSVKVPLTSTRFAIANVIYDGTNATRSGATVTGYKISVNYQIFDYTGDTLLANPITNNLVTSNDINSCPYAFTYNGLLFLYGNPSQPYRLYISSPGNFKYFPSNSYIDLDLKKDEKIVKAVFMKNVFIIFTNQRIFQLKGSTMKDFAITPLVTTMGCIDAESIISYAELIYFKWIDGFWRLKDVFALEDRLNVEKVDIAIQDFTKDQNPSFSLLWDNTLFWYYPSWLENYVDKDGQVQSISRGLVLKFAPQVPLMTRDISDGWALDTGACKATKQPDSTWTYDYIDDKGDYYDKVFTFIDYGWTGPGGLFLINNGVIYIRDLDENTLFLDGGAQYPIRLISRRIDLNQTASKTYFYKIYSYMAFLIQTDNEQIWSIPIPNSIDTISPDVPIELDTSIIIDGNRIITSGDTPNEIKLNWAGNSASPGSYLDTGMILGNTSLDDTPVTRVNYYLRNTKGRFLEYSVTIMSGKKFSIRSMEWKFKTINNINVRVKSV